LGKSKKKYLQLAQRPDGTLSPRPPTTKVAGSPSERLAKTSLRSRAETVPGAASAQARALARRDVAENSAPWVLPRKKDWLSAVVNIKSGTAKVEESDDIKAKMGGSS